jgi:hypothetical protein
MKKFTAQKHKNVKIDFRVFKLNRKNDYRLKREFFDLRKLYNFNYTLKITNEFNINDMIRFSYTVKSHL